MANAFMKEWLLLQLQKLGLPCPFEKKEEPPVVVKQTLQEAGYCADIPTDDIPVAYLPGVIRLDKESWLRCLTVEASFSAGVEDGDLVCPVATNTSQEFRQNIADVGDAIWKPFNSGAGTVPTGDVKVWGFAYKHIGRVMLGPAVFHQSFAFRTGDLVYAGESGKLTTSKNDLFVGVCVAPGTILIKQF